MSGETLTRSGVVSVRPIKPFVNNIHDETPEAWPNRQLRNRYLTGNHLFDGAALLIVNGRGLSNRYSIVGPTGRAIHKGLVQPFCFLASISGLWRHTAAMPMKQLGLGSTI
jgi:hypothetical protein